MSLLHGFGRHLSALTATPELIRVNAEDTTFYAKAVSVYNKAGADVIGRINDSIDSLSANSLSAVIIPAGDSFTFDGDNQQPIFSIALATSPSGNADVYIAAY